jgi:hypothetical protein
LAEGDFLLMIAGDEIDRRVARLSRGLLGDNLTLPWDLALVEVAVYERTVGDLRERMVVPALVHRVVPEARQIVRVETSNGGEVRVKVTHVAPAESSEGGRWTEGEYLTELERRQLSSQFKGLTRTLLGMVIESSDLVVRYGKGRMPSMTVRRKGNSILEVYLDGSVWWRRPQAKAALGAPIGQRYLEALTQLFPGSRNQPYPHAIAAEVAVVVPALVDAVQSALRDARSEDANLAAG